MPEWTPAQRKSIFSDAEEIICSAAAGSGKTAVMVERVVRFLKMGKEPDQFLIMTFTNAAAAEIREKIRNRLYLEKQDPVVRSVMDRIDQMQISTIHAFCQQLIRNQFQIVEIDPNFQICDASQRQILFHEAFSDACDQLKEENHPLFSLLRQRFEVKKAEQMIQNLEPFILSLPDPIRWMTEQISRIPEKADYHHPWYSVLWKMAGDHLYLAELYLSRMFRMFDEPGFLESYRTCWKSDAEMFHVKQSEWKNKAAGSPCVFEKLKSQRGLTVQESDWKDRYQKLRDEYKKQMAETDRILLIDSDQTLMEWKNMRESLEAVQLLLIRTENLFQTRKKARGVVDFQDLEQYAVQILTDPAGREEALSSWKYVFVDECQDNSAVQNHIISLLQNPGNHLFMVGDVKQSIYRFRLADPILFQERIQRCRSGDDRKTECIDLQANFRSRPEILETTNLVFRSIMKESVTEISYTPQEELIPGRKAEGREPVQAVRIFSDEKNRTDLEATAEFIRDEIETLLQTPYPGKNRNYRYRDCVVLMPAVHTDGPILADLLTRKKIPVFFDGSGDYYQLREIQEIRNLLEWIDFPLQDLPFLSVLQGAPFWFSEEELSQIRLKRPEKKTAFHEAFLQYSGEQSDLGRKCAAVYEKLKRWQDLSEIMRVSDLIWELYRDTGIYYVLGADPAGEVKQANLRMLAQEASQAESRGILTLRQFLAYMKDQQSYGDQQSATLLGDQDDLVRIMTIHKSKGLQFPVVFCAGMDKSPVGKDPSGISAHARLGLCMNYKDPEHRISRPTLAADIFAWQRRREEMAEKVRLLYVAMTRAQERLYLLTCQEVNPLWSMPEGEGRILAAKSFTDWWMPVFMQAEQKKLSTTYSQPLNPYEIRLYECNQQETVETEKDINSLRSWLESVISVPVVDEMWKKETEDSSPTLIKRSVTSVIKSARKELEEDLEEETAEKKRMPESLRRRMAGAEIPEMPEFLREKGNTGAAWRGTLTHRILSLMSLENLRSGNPPEQVLQEEMERMVREHIVSRTELEQIRQEQIAAFWKSEMGKRILRSPEVHREWNFNLLIERERKMILQGVIDCAFREGEEWVILDYKTDRGKTAEELREEYSPQLSWYARAIRELTGQPVREAALYSLELDRVIPVL